MKISRLIAPGAILAGVFVATLASAQWTKEGDSEVTFTAIGPAGLRIVGQTPDLKFDDDPQALTITVPLAHLTTGISLRDTHMRDKYLEVGTYPNAQLVIDRSALRAPADAATTDATVNATLRLHGQSRNVPLHYRCTRRGRALSVNGDMHINMTDFAIRVPSYLGVTVKPDVDIAARFVVNES